LINFENHSNYNCHITTNDGREYSIYANWLHNNNLDQWFGWKCFAGSERILIDKDFNVYGGECKNDFLGNALTEFDLLESTTCNQSQCTGCTDDLMVTKQLPTSTNSI